MIKLFKTCLALPILLISAIFPQLVFAAESSRNALDFTPPATDLSIKYLGSIFGVVDGVLAGPGTQILGSLFGVFNAAILAVGGMVLIYMLIVSTLNTAQEGKFMGQKWSSLWIPIRIIFGVSLLLPKASGYCLMQIFVMWIVVQGVGVADKIWGTGLDYMSRGGMLMDVKRAERPLLDPNGRHNPGTTEKVDAAAAILQANVCMAGLQNILEKVRQEKLAGPNNWYQINNKRDPGAVPDFIGSVNFRNAHTTSGNSARCSGSPAGPLAAPCVIFPEFPAGHNYAAFNGVCGGLSWANLSEQEIKEIRANLSGNKDLTAAAESVRLLTERVAQIRAIYGHDGPEASLLRALKEAQEQYAALRSRTDITRDDPYGNLDPLIKQLQEARMLAVKQMYLDLAAPARAIVHNYIDAKDSAKLPLGRLVKADAMLPVERGSLWEGVDGKPPLMRGIELKNAAAAYYTIMSPALRAIQVRIGDRRQFIPDAHREGWITAGSYFAKMLELNKQSTLLESDSNAIKAKVSGLPGEGCDGANGAPYCAQLNDLQVNHARLYETKLIEGALKDKEFRKYLIDASNIELGGAVKLSGDGHKIAFNALPQLPNTFKVPGLPNWHHESAASFVEKTASTVGLGIMKFMVTSVNVMLAATSAILKLATEVAGIFLKVNKLIINDGLHPIVAYGMLGNLYINMVSTVWVGLITLGMGSSILLTATPGIIVGFMIFIMPFVVAWSAIMLTAGFIMQFYLPLLPFLTFMLGVIAWFILVIEAMVGAPLWAFSFLLPGGEDQLGRGERGIFLLLNVFLRPALLVIGFIILIVLSYVVFWLLCVGYDRAMEGILGVSSGANSLDFMVDEFKKTANISIRDSWDQSLDKFASPTFLTEFLGNKATGFGSFFGFLFSVFFFELLAAKLMTDLCTQLIGEFPAKVTAFLGQGGEGTPANMRAADEMKGQAQQLAQDTSKAGSELQRGAADAIKYAKSKQESKPPALH